MRGRSIIIMFFTSVFRSLVGHKGRPGLPVHFSLFIIAFVVILLAITGAGLGIYKRHHRAAAPQPERITLGIGLTENAALVHIASDLGLFSKNGLDVSIREHEWPGHSLTDDLQKGTIDVAGVPELSLVMQGFGRDDFRTVAAIAVTDDLRLVARHDRGIVTPADLKGRTIGVPHSPTCRFFLDTFLAFNGILPSEVKIVDLDPSGTVSAVFRDSVDAAMLFEPYACRPRKRLGDRAIAWDGQSGQDYCYLLTSTRAFIEGHRGVVVRLLKSLIEAEEFAEANPEDAKKIVQRHLNLQGEHMSRIWSRTRLRVCLTQDLLIRMEDEARWCRKRMTPPGSMPNFYNYMYLDGLEQVRPEAVSVIH